MLIIENNNFIVPVLCYFNEFVSNRNTEFVVGFWCKSTKVFFKNEEFNSIIKVFEQDPEHFGINEKSAICVLYNTDFKKYQIIFTLDYSKDDGQLIYKFKNYYADYRKQ